MPIRIYESPDPLSDRTTGIEGELPLLIDSDAARLLVQEIKRYCHGEVTGRSFLIAGHRGAGKTTMVADAVLRVQRAHEEAQRRAPAGTEPRPRDARMLRPLFVPLHGPSILPDPKTAENRDASSERSAPYANGGAAQGGAAGGAAAGGASGGAAGGGASGSAGAGSAGGAGAGGAASGGASPGASAGAGGSATAYAADAAPAVRPTGSVPPARRDPRYADDAKVALEQITLYLHRAVARAFSNAMWARVREITQEPPASIIPSAAERAGRPSARHRSVLELAAQLDAEFYDFISAERLRQFWHRLRALDVGLLYRREDARLRDWAARSEQGMRELVALSSVFDAYARISGKYERSESLSNDAKLQEALTASIDAPAKTLGEPLIAILTGGLVGTGVAIGGERGLFPVIAGLLGALGASFAFKISSTRTRDRAAKAGYSFVYEKSEATLDRLIPVIIERLRLAGLAPIFVVDELDKVTDIGDRMAGMVHYLKKLVAESAFFCFLTDRAYFELVWTARHSSAYPVDYSYFTFTPYVVFREDDLHAYLDRVLRVEEPSTSDALAAEDEADKRVLRYVLLHRARMHTLDLRRHLAAIRGDDGEVNIRRGIVRTDFDYRFDVLLQLGIEYVLSRPELAKRMAREPEFRQVAYDAMYFLSRAWVHRALESVDLRDEKLDEFHATLEDRIGLERTRSIGMTTAVAALDADDVAMLYTHVRVLAVMLAKPLYYAERLSEWRREREEQGLPAIPQAAVDALALPENPDDAMNRPTLLAEVADTPLTYVWRFRPDGSAMAPPDVEEFVPRNVALATAWSDNSAFIDAFVAAIGRVTT